MKNLFYTSTLFFVSLLTATTAFAGNYTVPFEFEVAGRMMPAGSYVIRSVSATSSVYQLLNRESGKSLLVSFPLPLREDLQKVPRAVFVCQEAACELKELWPQSGIGVGAQLRKNGDAQRD
jgi:hypothetical protein